MMKLLFSFALLFAVSACSFKNDDSASNAQDRRDNELVQKLSDEYSQVEGVYSGQITSKDQIIPIELRLFVQKIESGTTSSGRTRYLPKLVASITLLESLSDDLNLTAIYRADSKELSLLAPSTSAAGNNSNSILRPDEFSADGKIENGLFDGLVKQAQGTLGRIQVRFQSRLESAQAPNLAERYERMRSVLAGIQGKFAGEIPSRIPGMPTLKTQILISVTSVGKPSLSVSCLLEDYGREEMLAEYVSESIPALLYIKSSGNGLRICPFISFVGEKTNTGFKARVTDRFANQYDVLFHHTL